MSNAPTAGEMGFVRELAIQAGEMVMSHYGTDYDVDDKQGQPVTVADRQSNELIVDALKERFPGDSILAEETPVTDQEWRTAERCWIVDPLDGTSDFVKGRVGFAVMIGLCVRGEPTLGVVNVPKAGRMFLGLLGDGAEEEREGERHVLKTSARAETSQLRVICSIAHRDEVLEKTLVALDPEETLSVGSVGYKVGKIVADEADLYVAPTGHICLWDTCAPQAILHAAGGRFLDMDGKPLVYTGPGLKHARGILATNGASARNVVSKIQGVWPAG